MFKERSHERRDFQKKEEKAKEKKRKKSHYFLPSPFPTFIASSHSSGAQHNHAKVLILPSLSFSLLPLFSFLRGGREGEEVNLCHSGTLMKWEWKEKEPVQMMRIEEERRNDSRGREEKESFFLSSIIVWNDYDCVQSMDQTTME